MTKIRGGLTDFWVTVILSIIVIKGFFIKDWIITILSVTGGLILIIRNSIISKSTYWVDTRCRNCWLKQGTIIKKGIKAEKVLSHGICQNCGCQKLVRERLNQNNFGR